MTVREKSRLDKFKRLLASPSTDLGEPALPLDSSLLPLAEKLTLALC